MTTEKKHKVCSKRRGEQEKSYRRWSPQENFIYAKYLIEERDNFST